MANIEMTTIRKYQVQAPGSTQENLLNHVNSQVSQHAADESIDDQVLQLLEDMDVNRNGVLDKEELLPVFLAVSHKPLDATIDDLYHEPCWDQFQDIVGAPAEERIFLMDEFLHQAIEGDELETIIAAIEWMHEQRRKEIIGAGISALIKELGVGASDEPASHSNAPNMDTILPVYCIMYGIDPKSTLEELPPDQQAIINKLITLSSETMLYDTLYKACTNDDSTDHLSRIETAIQFLLSRKRRQETEHRVRAIVQELDVHGSGKVPLSSLMPVYCMLCGYDPDSFLDDLSEEEQSEVVRLTGASLEEVHAFFVDLIDGDVDLIAEVEEALSAEE